MVLAYWVAVPPAPQCAQTHSQSSHVIGIGACLPRDCLGHTPTQYYDTSLDTRLFGILAAYAPP